MHLLAKSLNNDQYTRKESCNLILHSTYRFYVLFFSFVTCVTTLQVFLDLNMIEFVRASVSEFSFVPQ